jgi:hypothetical protein
MRNDDKGGGGEVEICLKKTKVEDRAEAGDYPHVPFSCILFISSLMVGSQKGDNSRLG